MSSNRIDKWAVREMLARLEGIKVHARFVSQRYDIVGPAMVEAADRVQHILMTAAVGDITFDIPEAVKNTDRPQPGETE